VGVRVGLWAFMWAWKTLVGLWALEGLWALKWPFVGVREAFVGVRVSLWALKWTWQTSFLTFLLGVSIGIDESNTF